MKIKQFQFKISELYSIQLNKNLSYPITNIHTLCKFINYKTFKLNSLYLFLIPEKIYKLKELKNQLLKIVYMYKSNTDSITQQDYFKQYTILKNQYPQHFKYFLDIGYIKELSQEQKKNITQTQQQEYFIESIKYTTEQINKAIEKYKQDLKHNKNYFEYKINPYDLEKLQEHILTNNIKKVLYYYNIKLLKTTISKKSSVYLNNTYTQKVLKNYQKKEIIKDFDLMLVEDLNSFENFILNRTI